MAVEMGVGVKSLKLVQEETKTLDDKEMPLLVEGKVGIQMQVPTQMQMQRTKTKERET